MKSALLDDRVARLPWTNRQFDCGRLTAVDWRLVFLRTGLFAVNHGELRGQLQWRKSGLGLFMLPVIGLDDDGVARCWVAPASESRWSTWF